MEGEHSFGNLVASALLNQVSSVRRTLTLTLNQVSKVRRTLTRTLTLPLTLTLTLTLTSARSQCAALRMSSSRCRPRRSTPRATSGLCA